RRERVHARWWLLVLILTLGVTSANLIQSLLCLIITTGVIEKEKRGSGSWPRVLLILVLALTITGSLSLVQKAIYPTTQIFFIPSTYLGTTPFFTASVWRRPLWGFSELAKQLLLSNVIGLHPRVMSAPNGTFRGLTTFQSWDFSPGGWLAAGLF